MRRVLIGLAAVIWSAAAVPVAGASAQATLPPDDSAVDEYTENVPGAAGDEPSSQVGGGGGPGSEGGGNGGGSTLPPGVADEFSQAGADGAAAAGLAQATAPDGRAAGGDPATGGSRSTDSSGGGVGGLVDTVVGAFSPESGGMGIVLPIILGATLVAALGIALARRRGPGQPGST